MMSNHERYKGNRSSAEYDPSWDSLRPRVIAEIPNINHFAAPNREWQRGHLLGWLEEKLVYKRLLTTSLIAISFFLVGLCGGLLVSVKPVVKTPMPESGNHFVIKNNARPEETTGSFNNGNWSNQSNQAVFTQGNQPSQHISPAEKQQAINILSQPVVRSDSTGVTPFPTLGSPITAGSSPEGYPGLPNEQLVSKPVNVPTPTSSGSSTYLQQESFGWNNLSLDTPIPSPAPAMMASTQTSYPNPEFHPQPAVSPNSNSTPFPQVSGFQQPPYSPPAGHNSQTSYSPPVMTGEMGQPYSAPLPPPASSGMMASQIPSSSHIANVPPQPAAYVPSPSPVPVSSTHGFVGYSNVGAPATTAPKNSNPPASTINSTMSQPMYESPTRGW